MERKYISLEIFFFLPTDKFNSEAQTVSWTFALHQEY